MTVCRALIAGLVLVLSVGSASAARMFGGRYSEERIANLRRNCERYEWARAARDKATSEAALWAAKSDEELWRMVPGQQLPRCIDVTFDTLTTGPRRLGCLQCGDALFRHGNYPYSPDPGKMPWKLVCPSCGAVFPTNDFGKYYQSGIDKHGLFDPSKADRRLLFNTAHPDPSDPLHGFGVDDGFGYVDSNGREHRFIGYYSWKLWRHLLDGLKALADAYVHTGDKLYARKAAVLLDRIADVYPSMDWHPYAARGWFHSDSSSRKGKIEGAIWECGVVSALAEAWDQILSGTDDSPELYAALKAMGERYELPRPKGTRDLLVQNVDDNVLRCAVAAVLEGRIFGNEGMHQLAILDCALALDTAPETTRWLDWLFEPGGGAIPGLIVNLIDRDGFGPESAPGYSLFWPYGLGDVAFRLAEYGRYNSHNLLDEYPQMQAACSAAWRVSLLGTATPNIGDAGETGRISCSSLNPRFMTSGYRQTRAPEIAVAAYRANGCSAEGLGRNPFDADPDALVREIEQVGQKAGPRPLGGQNISGYGLATLECGTPANATGLACYYGRTSFHGHRDQLNFDLLGFGRWLTPDLGYPEFCADWPSTSDWNDNTLSHNTVVVDRKPQTVNWTGLTRCYKQLPGFGVLELDCPNAYPHTREYARTMMLVATPDGNAYVVDLVRVEGGSDHLLSFHGPPGQVTTAKLQLTMQSQGTYAGPDVAFAARGSHVPLGYSYLYNVSRASSPPAQFQLDWKAETGYRGTEEGEDVHLRLHAFSACDDVALADGDPPQNKPGNPRRIRYALFHRSGADLSTTFVTLLEPYRSKPFIRSAERLDTTGALALRVELVDGTVDTVLWSATGQRVHVAQPDITFAGSVGFVRMRAQDRVTSMILVQGAELVCGTQRLQGRPSFHGKVLAMNRELQGGGWIDVDAELPADGSLAGCEIIIDNDRTRNACYPIERVERTANRTRVHCGPISFVKAFRGGTMPLREMTVPRTYTEGYLYDFEPGAAFRIPCCVSR